MTGPAVIEDEDIERLDRAEPEQPVLPLRLPEQRRTRDPVPERLVAMFLALCYGSARKPP